MTQALQRDVTLAWHEIYLAASLGVMRQIQNLRADRSDFYGCTLSEGWQRHIEGALGEAAVSKALDSWWFGNLGKLRADDAGHFQVRATTYSNGRLILHRDDDDDACFVLVTGELPTLSIAGWIIARDGKQERYWVDPTGKGRYAYFVPQKDLRPLSDLPDQ